MPSLRSPAGAPEAIRNLLQASGYVTKKDAAAMAAKVAQRVAQTMIGQTVNAAKTENALFEAFPDLRNEKSDLFKATAEQYQTMVKRDPRLKN